MKNNVINILLIEDEDADIFAIKKALKDNNISNNLYIAKSGEDGVRALNKDGNYSDIQTPDLIILDLNLPGMGGQNFLRQSKNEERFKRIPIIVMTSSDSEEDIIRSYNLGANCYLRKPIKFKVLKNLVYKLVDFWGGVVTLPTK